MKWVLVVMMITSDGGSHLRPFVTTQRFVSLEACQQAHDLIFEASKFRTPSFSSIRVHGKCIIDYKEDR